MAAHDQFPTVPSGPPIYVFDESGALVDWCRDSGDNPAFMGKWGWFKEAAPVSMEEATQVTKAPERRRTRTEGCGNV